MNNQLSDEARDFGAAVLEALESAGGVDITRKAETDPASRRDRVETLLDPLGLWDIEPFSDQVQMEAAGAACRAAGWHALAYPVAERLSRPDDAEALLFAPTRGRLIAAHADLTFDWAAVDLTGRRAAVRVSGASHNTKLGHFVGDIAVDEWDSTLPRHAAVLTTLQSWWLLGILERSMSDTAVYVQEREQFGRPLSKFQATQFSLTDLAVAVQGLGELAKYTLWSVSQESRAAVWIADAVALRLASLEAADIVLRGAHQLHGATSFADETNISWYSRVSQAVRRLPAGLTETEMILTQLVEEGRFTNLFSELPDSVMQPQAK